MNIIKNSRLFIGFLLTTLYIGVCFAHVPEQTEKKVNDMVIISMIIAKYTADKQVNPLDIKVSSENGVVQLVGVVETESEFERAVMIAKSVEGVRDVDIKNLKLKESNQPLSDILITAKIKGKLLKAKLFGDKDVNYWTVTIETKNGVVHLTGNVENEIQKKNILDIVNQTKDVKTVESTNLIIKPEKAN